MKILNEITKKALDKLEYYVGLKDKQQTEKFILINNILSKEDAILKLDSETAINILNDIYSDEEYAKKLYITIVQESAT